MNSTLSSRFDKSAWDQPLTAANLSKCQTVAKVMTGLRGQRLPVLSKIKDAAIVAFRRPTFCHQPTMSVHCNRHPESNMFSFASLPPALRDHSDALSGKSKLQKFTHYLMVTLVTTQDRSKPLKVRCPC